MIKVQLRSKSVTGAWVFGAAVFGIVSHAQASPSYPQELKTALDLSYVPACTLCHSSGGVGGNASTVDTPFGKSMVARGLRGATDSGDGGGALDAGAIDPTLQQALDAMRRDGVDSDGDGAEDLDELAWGTDPNTYDGLKPNSTPAVSYGCQMLPGSRSPGGEAILLLGFTLASYRRKAGSTGVRLA